ncbi:hypothetical protein GMORB2_6351 [Geosmithia morbida]|uniref:Tetraspanin Tsp3 n=1 Tax=Geosmithia morbida TaxID=1094350 RepID=A0A9P5D5C6_9HYPO|nr:uncharacterized protein GMORB2_6351 [Geosmithia morbida]KAF4123650.1 hypothetical protein GMORB2_6351 [Geosmithia morbida]
MSPTLSIAYLITTIFLFIVAVIFHVKSTSLSLPIPSAVTVLAFILPLINLLNASIYPHLTHGSPSSPVPKRGAGGATGARGLTGLTPLIMQVLQALATTVLATLLFEDAVPSTAASSCLVESRWSAYYRAHDDGAIRRIQDGLACCGFNSVRDRAYPFQRNGVPSTCPETYGRDVACRAGWEGATRSVSGIELAVVLATGLLQIFGLFVMSQGPSGDWWTTSSRGPWSRLFAAGQRRGHSGSRRPLLTAAAEEDDEEEQGQNGETPTDHGQRYGATDDQEGYQEGSGRPRVEPSFPFPEGNAWRSS